MSHKLFRLAKRYSNKPQLITQDEFEIVMDYLDGRNNGTIELQSVESKKYSENYGDYYQVSGMGDTAIVTLQGPLTYKDTGFSAMCQSGVSSYQKIKKVADTIAADSNISRVVLEVDSGGGQAYGCFAAARYVRDTLKAANIEILAYVDGMACSAAYAWASIADEIVINPLAEAGSVGVVVHLMDTSVAMQQAGLQSIYITAGDNKVPFAEDGSFKEEFLQEIQDDVDSLYTRFVSFVSEMRDLSEEDVRATEASVYSAEEAVSLGLVDRIMEIEDFYAELEVTSPVSRDREDEGDNPSPVDDADIQGDKDEDYDDKARASSTVKQEGEINMTVKADTDQNLENVVETPVVTEELVTEDEQLIVETPVVEAASDLAPQADLATSELAAKIAEMQAQLDDQAAQLNAANKAKELLESQDKARKLANLQTQAKAWAFAGVDAEAFSQAALTGHVPVEMMTAALDKVTASMDSLDAMAELGTAEQDSVEQEKKDGVEAALSNMKVKLRS